MTSVRTLEVSQLAFGKADLSPEGIAGIGKMKGLKTIVFKADDKALPGKALPALWQALPDCEFK